MKKQVLLIVSIILIICSVFIVVDFYSKDNLSEEKTGDVINSGEISSDFDIQYIDDEEEIKYSDETSKYGINDEYFDQDFVTFLKSVNYNETTGSYDFILNFRNITDENKNIMNSRLSCEVNQQSVVIWDGGDISVDSKKSIDVTVSCPCSIDDEVNVVYISTLFNGLDVTVKFGKR